MSDEAREVARLRAKAAYQAGAPTASASTSTKRSIGDAHTELGPNYKKSKVADDKSKDDGKLQSRMQPYVEFDLAVTKNTKGGFLVGNEEESAWARKERERGEDLKKKRLAQLQRGGGGGDEPAMSLDPAQNAKCVHCGSPELDLQLQQYFRVRVCRKCKNTRPDEYSLLTKTECKDDYLLTDPELKDEELLPHMLRPNPHRPNYSNMMLYLRCQVEAFAFSAAKWGSQEAMDEEWARREKEKKEKKDKKFEKKLKELRKRNGTNVWHKRMEGKHEHLYEDVGGGTQRCECGLELEVETF